MTMLRTIKVYGHLAEHCGKKTFKALARTPAEAVRFLVSNYPGLRALMRDGYYTVSLTGVAGFLTPTIPTPDIDNDPRNNFNFSGVQNTSREGIPVPVAYGEVIVGSVVISSGLNVDPLE